MITVSNVSEQPQNDQAEEAAPLTHEEQLEKELEDAQAVIREQKDKYLRLSAEFDNYRKRTMKEKAGTDSEWWRKEHQQHSAGDRRL